MRTAHATATPPRFAVLDVETTGFAYNRNDRIIEIGVVLLDSALRPEQHWETLLNPDRDLGPTAIHGIRGRDVHDAPEFQDVAEELTTLLEGRILVAHNAVFDSGFLAAEYRRLDVELGDLTPSSVCTMRLAPHALNAPARSLEDCCRTAGISNPRAHAALPDAEATARLFGRLSSHPLVRDEVASRTPLTIPPYRNGAGRPARALKVRPEPEAPRVVAASEPGGWVARIAATMPRVPVGPAEECYLAVLDRALADRHLSGDEKDELLALASALSLDRPTVMELHSRYLGAMTALALADGIVTDAEQAELTTVALQLGLADGTPSEPPTDREDAPAAQGLVLEPGSRVTFTGDMVVPREEWERKAGAKGLDVGGVTKTSALLVAADPDSLSGKAKKARGYGVPIVSEHEFARLIGAMP